MSKSIIKESVNSFGFELFKAFHVRHKTEYQNICFSPFAVYNSLAMILIGAENQSESQLASVLHLKDIKKDKSLLEEIKNLHELIIKTNHDIILSIRFLYINKCIDLKTEYINHLREYFEVKAKKVNFEDVDKTLEIINNDSKESTDGVVDAIIEKKDITGENKNVKLILTNSLFFRGFWSTSFEEVIKEKFTFGKSGEQSIEIQLIRHIGLYRHMYSRQLMANIVSIPYVASDLRMIVILPDNPSSDGFYLIEYLNKEIFENIVNTLQSEKTVKTAIDLSIPRFGLDAQKISVQRTIKCLGAIDIFDETLADLKSMSEQKVYLTKLVHKAFILVDERGSAVGDPQLKQKQKKKEMIKPLVFKANHPFVFLIADKATKVVAFMVYFGDPREMLEVVRESDCTPELINQLLSTN